MINVQNEPEKTQAIDACIPYVPGWSGKAIVNLTQRW
jgi:hypothetical protein